MPDHRLVFLILAGLLITPVEVSSQQAANTLVRSWDIGPDGPLPWNQGAVGVWQRLRKLGTTASVLYTTGHPDDEEAGTLTLLSRGEGVRTALLTLNRGEGGANAIGPELFDALGLIRSEELRLAGRYYGLDDQYFTTAIDYGYSKTLDEAFRSWDREALLGDMVRIIRTNRPLVVVSRWHGSQRDGHGHHRAAGILTPEAVEAAADPTRFPRQISDEGLRPWRVRKLYRGRIQDGESFSVEVNPDQRSPWLGPTYQALGAYGLSLQRSQTSGRVRAGRGAATPIRYERLYPTGRRTEATLFDGLDTSLPGVFRLTGETAPRTAVDLLADAAEQIRLANVGISMGDPGSVTPYLAHARGHLIEVQALLAEAPEAAFILDVERRELDNALAAALGVELEAIASRRGDPIATPMAAAVPGQDLDVHWSLAVAHVAGVRFESVRLESSKWATVPGDMPARPVSSTSPLTGTVQLTIPADARTSLPWFHRASISENRYAVRDSTDIHLGASRPAARLIARVTFADQTLELSTPVRTVTQRAPYGSIRPELAVVPPVSIQATPAVVLARSSDPSGSDPSISDLSIQVTVDVVSNGPSALLTQVDLELPTGWSSQPQAREIRFETAGQHERVAFQVVGPSAALDRSARQTIRARARVVGIDGGGRAPGASGSGGREYSGGYELISHRDLAPQRLHAEATVDVVPVDVRVAPDLTVGYVMGVGDDVPSGIEQLGATVELLDEADLSSGRLGRFQTIVVGTRAYAVRPDLVANNGRLIDYARAGGNLIVLYQTQEYSPETQAPYPATLPGNAQEVSEEDAPIEILAPDHSLLASPNEITAADFDGWIEQRGSKFFATWAPEYTSLIETHDTGQAPQEGIWLTAPVGDGHFTYASIALHRQLPYGVAGAYRILANLLSLGR